MGVGQARGAVMGRESGLAVVSMEVRDGIRPGGEGNQADRRVGVGMLLLAAWASFAWTDLLRRRGEQEFRDGLEENCVVRRGRSPQRGGSAGRSACSPQPRGTCLDGLARAAVCGTRRNGLVPRPHLNSSLVFV